MKNKYLVLTFLAFIQLIPISVKAEIVMVTYYKTNIIELDARMISRLYTGKAIEIDGIAVTPINQGSSNPLRARFLQKYLSQNEDKYSAYWTVRRFIGKGTPPKEFQSVAAAIDYIATTPGAIGYVDTSLLTLPNDIKIISK